MDRFKVIELFRCGMVMRKNIIGVEVTLGHCEPPVVDEPLSDSPVPPDEFDPPVLLVLPAEPTVPPELLV